MRPKVILEIILAGLGLLGVIFLTSGVFRQRQAPPATVSETVSPPASASNLEVANTNRLAKAEVAPPTAAPTAPNNGATDMTDAEHAMYVRQRTAELSTLAMNNDAVSRDAILAELQNPDKFIRTAALEAAIQFNDRSVVPRLKEIADQTEDPAEKAAIQQAIDYINLPSLTEYLAEQKAARAAGGQTAPPQDPEAVSNRMAQE
ncbi:MAG: HEAT repeat domain-containing protein [Verrucomicrobiia bacterium]|jgi:hypothetical protein